MNSIFANLEKLLQPRPLKDLERASCDFSKVGDLTAFPIAGFNLSIEIIRIAKPKTSSQAHAIEQLNSFISMT